MSTATIKAIWNEDERGVDECAHIAADLVSSMKDYDPLLSGWKFRGRSEAGSSKYADLSKESLKQHFIQSKGGEGNDRVKNMLGVRVGFWSSSKNAESVDISMGERSPFVYNSVTMDLPAGSDYELSNKSVDSAYSIMSIIHRTLDPDFTVWGTDEIFIPQTQERKYPYFGAVSMVSKRLSDREPDSSNFPLRRVREERYDLYLPKGSVLDIDAGLFL